jgi:hypothetical protein
MVELQGFNGSIIATTFTGSSGNYLFSGLAVGAYTVRVDEDALPPGGIFTTPSPQAVGLAAGEVFLETDFGWFVPA